MDQLELLRVFCAAAEAASFRAAAMRLGISPQAVTRVVKELEQTFGELLFHRSTRRVQITAFGEQTAKRARETLDAVDELFRPNAVRGVSELQGTVRITAPGAVGRRFLVRALARLDLAQITLDIRLSERLADVVAEKVDVGVRVGFMRDQRFVARAAAKIPFFVVATRRLLRRFGAPARAQDLEHLPVTALIDSNTGRAWPWYFKCDTKDAQTRRTRRKLQPERAAQSRGGARPHEVGTGLRQSRYPSSARRNDRLDRPKTAA